MNEEVREVIRNLVTDQRADTVSPGELRKGVNVLNTSDPKDPAPNPFVQAQNQTVNQNQQTNSDTAGQEKKSEYEPRMQ
jgi:hypothetical protein